ncbi:apurinic apyrimidinic endonuclease [Moniliophthora roreri MCA 2997]|uniref:Apurinic-apyrimidinic endonuclease 1 n=1 Tax=Moniliophthora roreri (strain MCA 2997) TaxID=1381753 RepID=V2X7J9_MONRO|nr:apurinic apyrimidinic endonuclease [Moniliophthora roreri MCA 2997]
MARKRTIAEAVIASEVSVRRSLRVTKKAKLEDVEISKHKKLGANEDIGEAQRMVASGSSSISSPIVDAKPKRTKKAKTETLDLSALPERATSAWKVGAHVSAAGGVENAVYNAAKIGANAFAFFPKSQRKWVSPALTATSIQAFKTRMKELNYDPNHVLPHGSYLINLGNPDAEKREKSYECFLDDLKRCHALGLLLYNFHPGSCLGTVPPSTSISHIADCINRAHKDTPGSNVIAVIENMAGAGNVIGGPFSQISEIISQVEDKSRVGVCLDTCHMFAAGYDIRTKEGWDKMLDEFEKEIGLKYLRGMHINDSKTACGSNKDRHDNIGLGYLSLSTFQHVLRDKRVQNIPLILETPAHEDEKEWNVWKTEIKVLNGLSNPGSEEDVDLAKWREEISAVVRAAGGGKEKKPKPKGKLKKKATGEEDDN